MHLQLYGKQIWLYRTVIDFRCSIDGLIHIIKHNLHHNPQHGIYLFVNRGRDKIKGLSWHKNGFMLFYKRLEQGKFTIQFNQANGVMEMQADELGWLLAGLDWQHMRNWRDLDYAKFS